ncbi:TetR/AcrR family transcriptional regulator [Streptantibioticus rubrisoli]|uniref:TetR family transcriptional regulator C-terminal domain-containing protein n=1 Tax=Streptantibioticus rubrisoli TaxID=1387313 RepID=A0ABT1PCI7_9ACTN|nr:TetR family transcriptional regulator C-terminal domain-containing protein [Streptantibioticus rubrisoli]MCQ4043072.1 TetR family transcriptional regulator C-terminal domain-containing protein [Streptantibioticus rubrisoli]
MPKIVDPEARRRAVAEAVFRVSARDGLEHASLRSIAREAGLAIGSVRHYFRDHAELMIFAMDELARRVGERIRMHAERLLSPDPGIDRRAAAQELLEEFLPLDAARHEQATLVLAFTTAARTRPELRSRVAEWDENSRAVITRVLREAHRMGSLPNDTDIPLESLRLTALIDGLTLQAVLRPDHMSPATMRRVLRRHLDTLKNA